MALSKQAKLSLPDFGMAETLNEEMTMDDVTHRGKVFSLSVDQRDYPMHSP